MADAATQPTGARDRGAPPSQVDLSLIDPSLRPSTTPSTGDTPETAIELSEPPSEPTSAQPMDIDNEYEDQPSDQEDEPHEPPSSRRHEHSDHAVFNTQYEKLDQLVTAVQKWARELGYNVVKGRSSNTVKEFGHTRLYFVCANGPIRKSGAHSRSTSTAKQGYS
ncbi:hypothetical protein QBC45DRAFT_488942 [Copromyces sp. CBS 386.78]|nr:hypothetical protein QBC45DRAFT_488942 [Copromyces sp. CBS 386.78]